MEYQIENADEITNHWVRPLEALSVKQFAAFSKRLEFPVEFTEELRSIAKHFVISVRTYLGQQPPETLPSKLYDPAAERDPLIQIWFNTLSQFDSIGVVHDIYRWQGRVHDLTTNERYRVRGATDWDLLLFDWAADPTNPSLSPLELPFQINAKLQSIVNESFASSQDMRFRIQRLGPFADGWDNYAFNQLHVGSWIHYTAETFIRLSKWKLIFALLSAEQLEILDAWGRALLTAQHRTDNFSLIQLAQDLDGV